LICYGVETLSYEKVVGDNIPRKLRWAVAKILASDHLNHFMRTFDNFERVLI